MAELVILGTSNAIPDLTHENTHMVIAGSQRVVMIDCVNNPIVRLNQAGIDVLHLTDLILTHFHPDHVSGVPSLLMNSWLMGRKEPLTVYGLAYTLDRTKNLMDAYGWMNWPDFFPVDFQPLPEVELAMVMDEEFRIFTTPVRHLIPTLGVRIEHPASGFKIAYSCDTEPCQEVVRLGRDTDILIHEATGEFMGHSSAAQAGEIARQAGTKKLLLIHYDPAAGRDGSLTSQAQAAFSGPVVLAEDFQRIEFKQ